MERPGRATGPEIIDWVFRHLPPEKAMTPVQNAKFQESLKNAPEGALSLLDFARENRKEFYQHWGKRIAEQQIEQEAKVSDGGEPVLQIIEKLEAALAPMLPPESPHGPGGQPGLPQETPEVSPDEF